jgi:hypothetical protein
MKPRIWKSGIMWYCAITGSWIAGIATTPEQAYWNWVRLQEEPRN